MEFLILIAGVAAVVWGGVLFWRGGPLGGSLAVLLAGCCFGHAFYCLEGGPIPLTLDRVLWAALIAHYLVWRRMGTLDPKPIGRADVVLLAWIGLLLISTFTHPFSVDGYKPVSRLLFYYLMPLGMYWVARQSRWNARSSDILLIGLGCFGLYLAATAVAEVRDWSWAVWPRYIASPKFPAFLGRGRGPLLNPAGNGFILSTCLAATVLLWPRAGRLGRTAIALAVPLYLAGIYCTLTRSVWLGAFGALAVAVWYVLPKTWRLPSIVGGVVLVAAVGLTQWENLLSFKRDENLGAQEAAESIKLRPILAMVAWQMFLDDPLTGCGFGHYHEASLHYTGVRRDGVDLPKVRPYHQHNVFLALLCEGGGPVMGFFVLLLGVWTADAWRAVRSTTGPPWARRLGVLFMAALAGYLANGMFHDVSIIDMFHMVFFFLAGAMEGARPAAEGAVVTAEARTERHLGVPWHREAPAT